MKYIFTAIIATVVILYACNNKSHSPLFGTDNLKTEQFTINPDRDTVLQTSKGALLKINKGSLVSADGKPVKLEIKEAYSMADIIKAGLTTTSNGQALSSGGMIYINAAKEQNVTIKEAIQVALPSNNLNKEMQLYKGEETADGKINWMEPQELPENKQLTAIEKGEALFQTKCASCHGIGNAITGPDLANFLKRFDISEEGGFRYMLHISNKQKPDSVKKKITVDTLVKEWVNEAVTENKYEDTTGIFKILKDQAPPGYNQHDFINERYIDAFDIYKCNLVNLFHSSGPIYSDEEEHDFEDILKYVQTESERKNLPLPSHVYLNDCADSCEKYLKRTKYLNELKTITEEKREKFIDDNGEMTVVIPDPTWPQAPLPPDDYSWKVSPNNYKATYYQFQVETFGWYNIDMLLPKIGDKVKESELFVTLGGDWKDRVNIFLIIPSYNVYGEGGPAARNPEEFAFFNVNGTLPLPQNEKAFILAVSEKDDKIGYALKEFTTGLSQQLEVEVKESTKEEFDKAIASLGAKQMSVTVKPSLDADSIRAADKQLKDIDKSIKDAEKLNPKNCDCDCLLGDEGGYLITKPVAINNKK